MLTSELIGKLLHSLVTNGDMPVTLYTPDSLVYIEPTNVYKQDYHIYKGAIKQHCFVEGDAL